MVAVAAVALVAGALGVVVYVLSRPDLVLPDGVKGDLPQWWDVLSPASWTVTGAILMWHRPENRVGWLITFVGACQAGSQACAAYGLYGVGIAEPQWPGARWVTLIGAPLWVPGLFPLLALVLAIYPDGRLPGPRWRVPVAASAVGIGLLSVAMIGGYNDIAPGEAPASLPDWPTFGALFVATTALCLVGGTVAIWVMSFKRLATSQAPERQQLAWYIGAVLPLLLLGILGPWQAVISGLAVALPVAIAVGVFRYGMLGIEFVLRRGLVFVPLTAAVLAGYLLAAALAGARFGSGPLAPVLTAALIAVGLAPLRDRLQRAVDRFVYGQRRDPISAVLDMGDTVAGAPSTDLLPTVLASVASALRASGARVENPAGRTIGLTGEQTEGVRLALRFGGETVGTLVVAGRAPGEAFNEADLRLLNALAPQVAVVVRAQDLTEALEDERDRVLAATTSERDRLRRDLHDGLGPSLSGIGLGLEAVETAVGHGDSGTATDVLSVLRAETRTAVSEVRRILDDLRPSALDGARLVDALTRYAATVSTRLPVRVEVHPDLHRVDPDLESAVYLIAQEALTNAVRHAYANEVRIGVSLRAGRVLLEVCDDGRGFSVTNGVGVGLQSMRYRAEGAGGTLSVASSPAGTTVLADLPFGGR